jgi:hypothetical protein
VLVILGREDTVKQRIGYFGCVLLAAGCAALAGAKGGLDAAKGGLDSAKGASDSAKSTADQTKAANAGGKGASAGAGDTPDDDDRLHATESACNAPLDDKLDGKKDKVDWRKFKFEGTKSQLATFELHWDDDKANLELYVYDQNGTLIGKNPGKLAGQTARKFVWNAEPGIYYVRVAAPTDKDNTIYTLSVNYKVPDGDKPAAAAAAPAPAPAAAPAAAAPGAPGAAPGAPAAPAAPVPFAQDPAKALASIVSAYRDGAGWVLQLDRGSGAKIRSGMSGSILEGPDGDKLLDGATFTIAQVIDSSKSIARSSMSKPIGKNKRVVINLK